MVGMRLVQAHLTELMISQIKKNDAVREIGRIPAFSASRQLVALIC
jgi:hypothetical protein